MKPFLQRLFGLMMLTLIIGGLFAQLPNIDQLTIFPTNPTTIDVVKIAAHTTFPSGECHLTTSSVIIIDTKIDVYVTHTLGPLTYICSSTDTISIGLLQSGTYTLRYHLSCTPYPPATDIDSVIFNVTTSTGIQNPEPKEKLLTIYPNPVENSFILMVIPNSIAPEVTVYDIFGKKIHTFYPDRKENLVDVSYLPRGVYIIEAFTDNNILRQKFIKQ